MILGEGWDFYFVSCDLHDFKYFYTFECVPKKKVIKIKVYSTCILLYYYLTYSYFFLSYPEYQMIPKFSILTV